LAATNHRNRFLFGKAGKLPAMDVNGLSAISPCSGHPMPWIKALFVDIKPVFCDLKSKFPLNLNIKYQRIKVK
jgi:hypothetical protein